MGVGEEGAGGKQDTGLCPQKQEGHQERETIRFIGADPSEHCPVGVGLQLSLGTVRLGQAGDVRPEMREQACSVIPGPQE